MLTTELGKSFYPTVIREIDYVFTSENENYEEQSLRTK